MGANLVSLFQLKKKGYYWDQRLNNPLKPLTCLMNKSGKITANINKILGQYVLKYKPKEEKERNLNAAFTITNTKNLRKNKKRG